MAQARKLDNGITSMQIFWKDKDIMSCFKKKNGNHGRVRYESDAQVIKRIIIFFAKHNKPVTREPTATYPDIKNTVTVR